MTSKQPIIIILDLINFKGNMLFTSHDQELMETVANRIIEINETKTFDKLTTYDEYLEQTKK